MREKIVNCLLFLLMFILGSCFTYYIVLDGNGNGVTTIVNRGSTSNGVIKCSNNVTIDETGISVAIGKIYDATVTIQNYRNNALYSSGSGFIYKKDEKYGYIMTNHHVVDGAESLYITMSDDEKVEGTVLGSDKYLDLAVVRIDVKYVKQVAEIGCSEDVNLGDTVFTVGTPVGYEYRGTVTRGTLSGKNRMVSVSVNSTDDWIMKVLQIDAAINPGNSGGPLVAVNGKVIGINSLKLVEDKVEGMGFAIPIEYALQYVDELEKGIVIDRPLVGISMLNVNDTFNLFRQGIMLDESITSGVVVVSTVAGSGADKAGLKKGDVITKIGDMNIDNAAYLKYELYQYNVGDTINITYIRGKDEKTTKITLTKSE